jgi:hypothetical protein
VKLAAPFNLSDVLKELAELQNSNAPTSAPHQQERILVNIIIANFSTQLQSVSKLKDEVIHEKIEKIVSLESEVSRLHKYHAELQQKVEEGIRKGWQLDELRHMLFGKKSERFVAYSDNANFSHPSLDIVFETGDVEAVMAASRARAIAEEQLADHPTGQPKTNRHNKAHHGRKGKARRMYAVEEVISEVDYQGDKTGLKRIGKK